MCGETFLFFRVGQSWLRGGGVLGESSAIASRLSERAAAGREERLVGLAVAFLKPFAEHGDGLAGERRGSLFASLPEGLHVRAGSEVHVLAAEAGELGDTQPGLDRDVSSSAWSRRPIQRERSGAASSASTSSAVR